MPWSKLARHELEFLPGEHLHFSLPGRRVRNEGCGVVVQVLAADGVREDLAKRPVDVMGGTDRQLLAPGADGRRGEPVDPSPPERVDGVLQSIAQRRDRYACRDMLIEVLLDEFGQRGRVGAIGLAARKPSKHLVERCACLAFGAEAALLWSRSVWRPVAVGPALPELVDLAGLDGGSPPQRCWDLSSLQTRTDAAAQQELLPVGPEKADRAAFSAEAIAGDVSGLEPIEHPVRRESEPLGNLARGQQMVVNQNRGRLAYILDRVSGGG